ncbi:MAG: tetratricopeptide repeat protein [Spirochaetota bacterium]
MANGREIKIQRNVVERGLMAVLEFVKSHRRLVLYSFTGLILGIILITVSIVYIKSDADKNLVEFETVLDEYRQSYVDSPADRQKNLEKTVEKLNEIIDSSYWGYVNENGYYIIGTLYYNENMYKEARKYFLRFADNSSSFFTPLAYQQAAISSEHLGDFKKALDLYSILEKDYDDSYLMDQVYYNLGRMYQKEKNIFKAKEYYKKVMSEFPQSFFAKSSKNRLLLLGAHEDIAE